MATPIREAEGGPEPPAEGVRPGEPLRSAVRVVHPALELRLPAMALAEARLTDRQRVAAVLQGAALLSLLDRAGWQVPADWSGARITPAGLLVVEGAGPGRSPLKTQELLRDLLARLFFLEAGPLALAGRGDARRAARALLDGWRQSLAPIPADEAVAQVLAAAPFLWWPAFAAARRALAGELLVRQADGDRTLLWVAGPGAFRSRLLAGCRELAQLQDRVAGPAAEESWHRREEGDPGNLMARGRWRAAVAAWERRPPASDAERIGLAQALSSLGRFEAALAVLTGNVGIGGAHSTAAALLRVRCQLQLGQLRAGRATLRRLELTPLAPAEAAELAEVAVRVYANSGDLGAAGVWARRALDGAAGRAALRARLVAAAEAWDRGDRSAMDGHLEQAQAARDDPDLAWRWYHLRGLRALLDADGPAAVENVATAIRQSRRTLARHEAAGLWNDLGLGRAQVGDLAGSERAFLHALRLYGGCEGPKKTTLALHNLAEVRLRRGRLAGVCEILERSTAENRLSGNVRGLAQDLELWARHELVLGRAEAALALCRDAVRELDRRGVVWRRAEIAVLAARALGWLGRRAEAGAELAGVGPGAVAEQLEPEERPALWAHAGLAEAALAAAAATPFAAIWKGLLRGEPLPTPAWEAVDRLEPYRAARMVFDCETIRPRSVPSHRLRAAIATLRNLGAGLLADRLQAREEGPWHALAAYAASTAGLAGRAAGPDWLALLAGVGHPEAELVWTSPAGERRVLGAGAGGGQEISASVADGILSLRAPQLDAVLEALFALIVRDLERGLVRENSTPTEVPPQREVEGGMIGESPALREAMARIARLAPGDLPVLILGESGTGKELAARQVHRASPRGRGAFVAVNCAALSETLLLSDLFGHVRGAFTGADRDRAGVFEAAQGGTVLLDEIGDLPPVAQGMLLRVLQEREVRRVGESLPRKVDVRVLAATHRDLERMVREGSFRQDLFYRLRVGRLVMPPLRDRGDDVLQLAEHVLARFRASRPVRLSPQAKARLLGYSWPGNVRELQNVLSAAAALAEGGVIGPEHLELAGDGAPAAAFHQRVDAYCRSLIEQELAACGGNHAEAARRLGLSRQGLSYRMRRYRRS